MPTAVREVLTQRAVLPRMLVLASDQAPNRTILCVGVGTFETAHIALTSGAWIRLDKGAPERLVVRLAGVCDRAGNSVSASAAAQASNEIGKAMSSQPRTQFS